MKHNCQYCCDCGCNICYSIWDEDMTDEEKRIMNMIKAVKCDGTCDKRYACKCPWKRKDKNEVDLSKPFRREVERE